MASDQRKRPPQPESIRAKPGGDAVTEPEGLEADDEGVRDHSAVTRPVDLEEAGEDRAEPGDA